MNALTRYAALSLVLLAGLTFDEGHPARAADAPGGGSTAKPDFSGVWLPNSRKAAGGPTSDPSLRP